MSENKEQLKRFYEDAIYYRLIHKGYSADQARNLALRFTEQHIAK